MLKTGWLLMFVFAFGNVVAQSNDHIDWRFSSVEQSGSEWKLVFAAKVDRGWHLYSQSMDEGGPMPTSFSFNAGDGYRMLGKTIESGDLKKSYDSTFMMDVSWYEGQVVFSQKVKVKKKTKVTGTIEYSVCSEEVCIPGVAQFNIEIGR